MFWKKQEFSFTLNYDIMKTTGPRISLFGHFFEFCWDRHYKAYRDAIISIIKKVANGYIYSPHLWQTKKLTWTSLFQSIDDNRSLYRSRWINKSRVATYILCLRWRHAFCSLVAVFFADILKMKSLGNYIAICFSITGGTYSWKLMQSSNWLRQESMPTLAMQQWKNYLHKKRKLFVFRSQSYEILFDPAINAYLSNNSF